MKNIKIALFIPVALLGAGNTFAATVCGRVYTTGDYIEVGREGYMCLKTTNVSDIVKLDRNYSWACLQYSTDYQTASDKDLGHHYLHNCTVSQYSCAASDFYNGHGCTACSTGSEAAYDGHTNMVCDNCITGYYFDGSICVRCPNDGYTDPITEYQRPKTKCFLAPGPYSDETGNFEILPGLPNPDGGFDYCYWTDSDESGDFEILP